MKKFRMICGVICLAAVMSFATACSGDSKTNTTDSSNTTSASETTETTTEPGKDGDNNVALVDAQSRNPEEVTYKEFRVFVDIDDSLHALLAEKEQDADFNSVNERNAALKAVIENNGGIIPNSLLTHTFIVHAYILNDVKPHDIIIADNATDALNKLNNNFTLDASGKKAIFRSDVTGDGETPNEITVDVDTLETGELYIKATDNIMFVEYDNTSAQ